LPTTCASCGVSRRDLDKHRGINDGATTVLQGEGGVSLGAIVAWGLGYSASWDLLAAGAVGCPVSYALARASLRKEARPAYRPEYPMPIAETLWGMMLDFTMVTLAGRTPVEVVGKMCV